MSVQIATYMTAADGLSFICLACQTKLVGDELFCPHCQVEHNKILPDQRKTWLRANRVFEPMYPHPLAD